MIRYSRGKQLLFRSMALRQLRGIRVEFIDRDMTTGERKAVRQFQRKAKHVRQEAPVHPKKGDGAASGMWDSFFNDGPNVSEDFER